MHWYPMRVTYNRELQIKLRFDELGIENFIPMRYEVVISGGDRKRKLRPAVHNLIFVRSTKEQLTALKFNDPVMQPLRYMMRRPLDGKSNAEIITVPDIQMTNFMHVCEKTGDENLQYLHYDSYLDKPGQRVRIIDGNFAGVEGVVKRIKKNKQVVVMIPGVVAVMLNGVPYTWLQKI